MGDGGGRHGIMGVVVMVASIVVIGFLFLLVVASLFIPTLRHYLLVDVLKGFPITGKRLWRKKKTVQYPEESMPISPRFKGMLALRRYPNGRERCIACKLCEAVCPALAITIESEPTEQDQRQTTRFDIDVFKCINCGLCAEACPVDSIVTTDEMHYSVLRRGDNIMTKQDLLAVGDMYEDKIKANQQKIHEESQHD